MVKKLGLLGIGICVGFVGGVVAHAKYGKQCGVTDETKNIDSDDEDFEEFVELTEESKEVDETENENASNEATTSNEATPETKTVSE